MQGVFYKSGTYVWYEQKKHILVNLVKRKDENP